MSASQSLSSTADPSSMAGHAVITAFFFVTEKEIPVGLSEI
jgi:hypothetical protein